jgi:hypothetical protein
MWTVCQVVKWPVATIPPAYLFSPGGVTYGEQLVYDIERLKRHFPAVPVKVTLIDADE